MPYLSKFERCTIRPGKADLIKSCCLHCSLVLIGTPAGIELAERAHLAICTRIDRQNAA
jgi:hypothetical protein